MALKLAVTEQGDGPPVVILHGLYGSGRNWASVGQQLAATHRVLLADLRNHGNSPWDDVMDYPSMADDVRQLLDDHGIDRAAVVGHSMGGKVAIWLAFEHPDRVERLGIVDVAPLVYPPTLRAYAEAMLAIDLDRVTRRAEVDQALASEIPEASLRGFLLQNLVSEGGKFRWRLNLRVLARDLDEIAGYPPLPSSFGYAGPTRFIRGALSEYVPLDAWPDIQPRFPAADLVTIEGAGHWLHAEKPVEFLAALREFLAG
ncbi:MAG TPA: alpha/beta fold hydrolase [Stellaceae bacterium]|nr:alpha/beta fold hydrolase [Stellaceae bacterium]